MDFDHFKNGLKVDDEGELLFFFFLGSIVNLYFVLFLFYVYF